MKISLVMTGRAYDQAATLPTELELADGAKVSDALQRVEELLPGDGKLPSSCLIAVAGSHIGMVANHGNPELTDGVELTLISPVAGG